MRHLPFACPLSPAVLHLNTKKKALATSDNSGRCKREDTSPERRYYAFVRRNRSATLLLRGTLRHYAHLGGAVVERRSVLLQTPHGLQALELDGGFALYVACNRGRRIVRRRSCLLRVRCPRSCLLCRCSCAALMRLSCTSFA